MKVTNYFILFRVIYRLKIIVPYISLQVVLLYEVGQPVATGQRNSTLIQNGGRWGHQIHITTGLKFIVMVKQLKITVVKE